MAIDSQHITPSLLVQILNSTPLGVVLTSTQLYRQRMAAGLRIGDGRTIDLKRYVAWLVLQKHASPRRARKTYAEQRDAIAARQKSLIRSARDIHPLPKVANSARKSKCKTNFRAFCEHYFPETFFRPWSPDHLKVIHHVERAVLTGGLFALAMPRGSGKSALAIRAGIWAVIYGHHRFMVLIAATEKMAESMLDAIKTELESNERLNADFPEACYPIRCLEGIPNRAAGQLYKDGRTNIVWKSKEVVFPRIPNRASSQNVIAVAGLTGQIRGLTHTTYEGDTIRPSLVILDDPQTDESARSPAQSAQRIKLLMGAILNLCGPGRKMAGIMPCTVIRPRDMADQILDNARYPEWQGERTRMMYKFPSSDLWHEYRKILVECFSAGGNIKKATDFYTQNRSAMDRGAQVAWEARYNPDEASAVQHAMNLLYRDEDAFWSEFQNEPRSDVPGFADDITVEDVISKINHRKRGVVPQEATHLTMFVDVMHQILYYMVCAWADNFTGAIVDYGAFPDQHQPFFSSNSVKHRLSDMFAKGSTESRVYQGLDKLTQTMLGLEWRRDDGAVFRVERCMIDASEGRMTDMIYQFARQSKHAALIMPSHGRGVGASSRPFSDWKRKPGERLGLNWIVTTGRRSVPHVTYDTNYWKSFVHSRIAVPMGDRGCLSVFGRKPGDHRLLAEHVCAEYKVPTTGRGRTVDEWKLRPENFDNHWLDCLVGCAVGASIGGVVLAEAGEGIGATPARRKVKIPDRLRRRKKR